MLTTMLLTAGFAEGRSYGQEPPGSGEQIRALQRKVQELEERLNALQGTNPAAQIRTNRPPDKRIEELDEKVKTLEQERQLDQEAAQAKSKLAPKIMLDETGFSFVSADENFRLHLRGYIQADGRFYLDDTPHATDTFLLERVRPVIEGTVFKNFDFKLMPDFGQGKSVIQDAYLDAHFLPWLNVMVGKYKAPVGLERLQSARDLIFVERSLPTDIAPNRDIGVWLHGEFAKGLLNYQAGVFNGAPDGSSEDSDENNDKDVDGRIFANPFRLSQIAPLEGLGVGIAGTIGHEKGVAPSYNTVGQQTFFTFNSGVTAHGNRDRISPQGYYYWGPFGLMSEYIVSYEDVSKGALTKRLRNSAWEATASYLVTEEKASYTGVVPLRPFNPLDGRWGAFELKARVTQLTVDGKAFENFGTAASPNVLASSSKSASQATTWGVGFNWYLNRDVKFMFDYDLTHFDGGAPKGSRPEEHALFGRVQVAW